MLAGALAEAGIRCRLHQRRTDGTWTVASVGGDEAWEHRRFEDGFDRCEAVIVAYQPFLYGRWGFSPWLPLALRRLRRRPSRPKLVLFVHERPVPPNTWRWVLMGLWQRVEFFADQLSADTVFVTIEAWRASLRSRFAQSACCIPVASSLPDRRAARQTERARLGIGVGTLVLTLFGTSRPDRRLDFAVAAANRVASAGHSVLVHNLGAGAPHLTGLDPRVGIDEPGELTPNALASLLAAGDVFLAPFVDGVSTRRTTLMAALQHGLAIVGTDGFLTDDVLRRSSHALHLSPSTDRDAFVDAVVRLSEDPASRESLGEAAATLYRSEFDWPVAARRVIGALALETGEVNSDPLA